LKREDGLSLLLGKEGGMREVERLLPSAPHRGKEESRSAGRKKERRRIPLTSLERKKSSISTSCSGEEIWR